MKSDLSDERDKDGVTHPRHSSSDKNFKRCLLSESKRKAKHLKIRVSSPTKFSWCILLRDYWGVRTWLSSTDRADRAEPDTRFVSSDLVYPPYPLKGLNLFQWGPYCRYGTHATFDGRHVSQYQPFTNLPKGSKVVQGRLI